MKKLFQLIIIIWFSLPLMAQEDPTLMTIDGHPIKLSEFSYIYEKNNGKAADYSKESVEEYLDLFTNFKLKVHKAKSMGMDTISSLNRELDGYRQQLADSYLMDRELSERLIKEMYDRRKQDVRMSHILFKLNRRSNEKNLEAAMAKAREVKEKIDQGKKFTEMVSTYSEDANSVKNGGDIGYITAWLPSGFYDLENAGYNLKVGEVSDPIVTKLGVHIVKVTDKRPAYGKIKVAHILIRHDSQDHQDPEHKINEIYQMLENGQPFDELAKSLSEDKASAPRGGELKPFGINTFERNFEDVAFGLKKDGQYSQPVETRIGWHIIKRLDKPAESYAEFAARMKPQLPKLDRYQKIKDILVNEVKEDYGFEDQPPVLQEFVGRLDETFFSYRWRIPEDIGSKPLFSFGKEMQKNIDDFAAYLSDNSRARMRYSNEKSIEETIDLLYGDYVKEVALDLEKRNLENKYPDFEALMREYREGILLFEVSKRMVWDKASTDTVGLQKFYEENQENYYHPPKALVSEYIIPQRYRARVSEIYNYAKNHSPAEVLDKYNKNKEMLIVEQKEKDMEDKAAGKMVWEKGAASPITMSSDAKTTSFFIIEKVIPSTPKTLEESRGYVIADYQQFLEKKWVENLKKEYEVEYNTEVLNNMIKS